LFSTWSFFSPGHPPLSVSLSFLSVPYDVLYNYKTKSHTTNLHNIYTDMVRQHESHRLSENQPDTPHTPLCPHIDICPDIYTMTYSVVSLSHLVVVIDEKKGQVHVSCTKCCRCISRGSYQNQPNTPLLTPLSTHISVPTYHHIQCGGLSCRHHC
jgi:hypothetical protein